MAGVIGPVSCWKWHRRFVWTDVCPSGLPLTQSDLSPCVDTESPLLVTR